MEKKKQSLAAIGNAIWNCCLACITETVHNNEVSVRGKENVDALGKSSHGAQERDTEILRPNNVAEMSCRGSNWKGIGNKHSSNMESSFPAITIAAKSCYLNTSSSTKDEGNLNYKSRDEKHTSRGKEEAKAVSSGYHSRKDRGKETGISRSGSNRGFVVSANRGSTSSHIIGENSDSREATPTKNWSNKISGKKASVNVADAQSGLNSTSNTNFKYPVAADLGNSGQIEVANQLSYGSFQLGNDRVQYKNNTYEQLTDQSDPVNDNRSHLGNATMILVTTSWQPPPLEVWKINVDSSFQENTNDNGTGLIIRDFSGQCKGIRGTFKHGIVSAEQGECLAVREALVWAKDLGLQKIIVEADAQFVIESLKGEEFKVLWENRNLIKEIKALALNFNNCHFNYAKRNCNQVADVISRKVRESYGCMELYSKFPDYVMDQVAADLELS